MRRVLILLITTVLIVAFVGCASLPIGESPEIQAVYPKIAGLDFNGVDMEFDVDVNNPYPIPLKTPRFRYGMDIEGSQFFESESTAGIDLPASGVGTVTLPVRLSYTDLFRTYQDLSGVAEANYTLKGALVLSALGRSFDLPMSHSGTFPIVRPPAFSDINVQLSKVSLTRTGINVDALMKNPNAFAVGIESLGYALKLGDSEVAGLTATTLNTLGAGETGRLNLTGEISATSALSNLIGGFGGLGKAKILPTGAIQTPYGPIKFSE